MHTVIVGAGALGSILGGYMAETGENVTLIGRQPHVDAIRADGLIIEGMRGRHVVRMPSMINPSARMASTWGCRPISVTFSPVSAM